MEAAKGSLEKYKASKNPPFHCISPHTGKQITTVIDPELSEVNKLSQANVLEQVEHLMSYTIIKDRIAKGKNQPQVTNVRRIDFARLVV